MLMHLVAGRSNKAIAAALMLSELTVAVHVKHILHKPSCETRTQAATYTIASGRVQSQVPF